MISGLVPSPVTSLSVSLSVTLSQYHVPSIDTAYTTSIASYQVHDVHSNESKAHVDKSLPVCPLKKFSVTKMRNAISEWSKKCR